METKPKMRLLIAAFAALVIVLTVAAALALRAG